MNTPPPDYSTWTQEEKNQWWADANCEISADAKSKRVTDRKPVLLDANPGEVEPSQDAGASGSNQHQKKHFRTEIVSPGAKPKFELVPFDKIAFDTACPYLVKGLVPRVGLTVMWGPPKCGKSFFAFDLAMHVALGWPYRGRRVQPGAVVYLALEGAAAFRIRVEAFRHVKLAENAEKVPFHLVASPIGLVADQAALVASIRASLKETRPALIVIDTLNRSLAGSESDDRDMSAYVRAADAIRDAFACAVVIIHHCGIDATRPRGHTSLVGAADVQIAVKRDAAENIIATVEWMKDGPQGDEIVSRLVPIEVGRDEEGDSITSCVIEPVEGTGRQGKPDRIAKLTKGAKIALDALNEAIAELGAEPPASNHIPAASKTVTRDQWRDYAYRRGISTSDKESAPRMAFARASECLLAARRVGIWDQHVWIV